eukprot:6639642-Karenia_brevis.AAC.1
MCVASMLTKDGVEKTDVEDIAEVFADFFSELYSGEGSDFPVRGSFAEVTPITPKEVRTQLKKMRNGKAADERGVIAELITNGSEELIRIIADLFTAVLKPGARVP